jgi:hypothetical protein
LVEEAQDKISRHAKKVIYADLFESGYQVLSNRDF